jgi:hypothetical protein
MRPILALILMLVASSIAQAQSASCSYWDSGAYGTNNTLVDISDNSWHINGVHALDAFHDGTCTYVNESEQNGSPCIATVFSADNPSGYEAGLVYSPIGVPDPVAWKHSLKTATTTSSNSGTGGVAAQSSAALGVAECLYGYCGISISVTLGGLVKMSITTGIQVWDHSDNWYAYCPSHIAQPVTPIIIDTANEGFQLTSLADGVVTDMATPGHPVPLAWTKPGSRNAFLWLNNHLFGNLTPQPFSDDPNGFRALAVYDTNGDGVIDAKDSVFANLRLWIDANHDAVAQPDELFTLPSLGVYSISLHYVLDKYTDGNGNAFRYRGHIQQGAPSVDRTIYDVFLSTK